MKLKHFGFGCLAILAFVFTSCGDDSHGYVEMEDPEPACPMTYLGVSGNYDYDEICAEDYGEGYLSFNIIEDGKEKYACREMCSSLGSKKGECSLVNNVHYGLTYINEVFKCQNVDGKQVYMPYAYQHCNHACNSKANACD